MESEDWIALSALILVTIFVLGVVLWIFKAIVVTILLALRGDKKPEIGPCVYCHKAGLKVTLKKYIGEIIQYQVYDFSDFVCELHAKNVYVEFQKDNFYKGWWSIYGIIRTPFALTANYIEYRIYKKSTKNLI